LYALEEALLVVIAADCDFQRQQWRGTHKELQRIQQLPSGSRSERGRRYGGIDIAEVKWQPNGSRMASRGVGKSKRDLTWYGRLTARSGEC
jgi:hypothetical protein